MSKREEILDMAVHALTPLMAGQPQANAADLFDQSIEIAEKLIEHVDATAENDGAPDRDELLDLAVHAMSALLRGRPSASAAWEAGGRMMQQHEESSINSSASQGSVCL